MAGSFHRSLAPGTVMGHISQALEKSLYVLIETTLMNYCLLSYAADGSTLRLSCCALSLHLSLSFGILPSPCVMLTHLLLLALCQTSSLLLESALRVYRNLSWKWHFILENKITKVGERKCIKTLHDKFF